MISNVKNHNPVNGSLSKTAISLGGIGFLAPQLAMQFESHLSEIISNSEGLLRAVIQNKIAIVKPAHLRNKKWYWKRLNRLFNVDSDYIELSGMEIFAVCRLLKEAIDVEINPKHTYLVPVGEAERILSELNTLNRPC